MSAFTRAAAATRVWQSRHGGSQLTTTTLLAISSLAQTQIMALLYNLPYDVLVLLLAMCPDAAIASTCRLFAVALAGHRSLVDWLCPLASLSPRLRVLRVNVCSGGVFQSFVDRFFFIERSTKLCTARTRFTTRDVSSGCGPSILRCGHGSTKGGTLDPRE